MRIIASTLFLGVSLLAFTQDTLSAGDGERKRTVRKRAVIGGNISQESQEKPSVTKIADAPKFRKLPDPPNFKNPRNVVDVKKKDLPHIPFFGDVSRKPALEILGDLNVHDRISTKEESNLKAWNIEALITLINGSSGKGGIRNKGGENGKGLATGDEASVMMSTILDFCENNRKLIPNAGNVTATLLASLFNHTPPANSHIYTKKVSDVFEKKIVSEQEARHRLGIYALIRSCNLAYDKLYGKDKRDFVSFDEFVKTIVNEIIFEIGTINTRQAKGFEAINLRFVDRNYLVGAKKGLHRLLEANSNTPGKINPLEHFYKSSLVINKIREKNADSPITKIEIDNFFDAPKSLYFITEKITHSNEEPLLRDLLKTIANKALKDEASHVPFTVDEWNGFTRKDFIKDLNSLNDTVDRALGREKKEKKKTGGARDILEGAKDALDKMGGTLQERAIASLKESKLWTFFNPNRKGAYEDQERILQEEKEKEEEIRNKNLTLHRAAANNNGADYHLNKLNELHRTTLGHKKTAENEDTGIQESSEQAKLTVDLLEQGFNTFDNIVKIISDNAELLKMDEHRIIVLEENVTNSKQLVENEKASLEEIIKSTKNDDISQQIGELLGRISRQLDALNQDDDNELSQAFNISIQNAKNALAILENLLEEEQETKKAAKGKVDAVKRIILDMPEFNSPDDIPENHVSSENNKLLQVNTTLDGSLIGGDSPTHLEVDIPCYRLEENRDITIFGKCTVQFVTEKDAKKIKKALKNGQQNTFEVLIDTSNVFLVTDQSNANRPYYILGGEAKPVDLYRYGAKVKKIGAIEDAVTRIMQAKNDGTGIIK